MGTSLSRRGSPSMKRNLSGGEDIKRTRIEIGGGQKGGSQQLGENSPPS